MWTRKKTSMLIWLIESDAEAAITFVVRIYGVFLGETKIKNGLGVGR